MPIKVTCTCGAAFAAKDELAGKTVKCPKCQQPLTIPGGVAAQKAAPVQRPAAPTPQPAADSSAPNIFDEAGIKAKQHTGIVCPSCYHPMKQGTIICVHCGYNMQLGRKMETQVHGRGDGGHGEAAAIALQRAANMLEDDKKEEKKKTSEGIPWWGYLLMFTGAAGLLTMMLLLPAQIAGAIAGVILVGMVLLAQSYAWLMVVIIAFRESTLQGLLAWFVPCYWEIYCILRWDQCSAMFFIRHTPTFIVVAAAIGRAIWLATA